MLGTSKEDGPSVLGKAPSRECPCGQVPECGLREPWRLLPGEERAVEAGQGLQRQERHPFGQRAASSLLAEKGCRFVTPCVPAGPSAPLWAGAGLGWAAGRWAGRISLQQQTQNLNPPITSEVGGMGWRAVCTVSGGRWSRAPFFSCGCPTKRLGRLWAPRGAGRREGLWRWWSPGLAECPSPRAGVQGRCSAHGQIWVPR